VHCSVLLHCAVAVCCCTVVHCSVLLHCAVVLCCCTVMHCSVLLHCAVAVCCCTAVHCSVLLQCAVAVCCCKIMHCSVLLHCAVALCRCTVVHCSVLLHCAVALSCCIVLLETHWPFMIILNIVPYSYSRAYLSWHPMRHTHDSCRKYTCVMANIWVMIQRVIIQDFQTTRQLLASLGASDSDESWLWWVMMQDSQTNSPLWLPPRHTDESDRKYTCVMSNLWASLHTACCHGTAYCIWSVI